MLLAKVIASCHTIFIRLKEEIDQTKEIILDYKTSEIKRTGSVKTAHKYWIDF